jgi:hypothetical protein
MLPLHVVQEKLLGELSLDMETTTNRLDFVQVCFVLSAPAGSSLLFLGDPALSPSFSTAQHAYYEISFLPMYYQLRLQSWGNMFHLLSSYLGVQHPQTSSLLFVQKRVAMVMKKASWKGQIMMIAFLVILFIILFVLVFLT